MRHTKQAIAALCLINSSSVLALGIGEITTHSALNQLLNAKIPLVSSKNEDPSTISVDLASRETFKKAGLDRPQYLSDLEFTPVVNKNGDVTINVTSSSLIQEPFVNFILEVEWPQGRTLKEFTILLDPPVTMADVTTAPVQPPKTTTITPIVPSSKPTQETPVQKTKPVSTGVPVNEYGPTASNDTVWGIAEKLRQGSSSITQEQMMMALFENNPDAFYKNNINALKKGQVLQVPANDVLTQLSPQQARSAFRDQNSQWSSSSAKAGQAPSTANTEASISNESSTDAKLTLLTPDETINNQATPSETSNSASNGTGNTDAATQANIALEMAATIEQENKDVKNRLTELETQVEKLQRLIALKDDQLAQLQNAPKVEAKTAPAPKKETPKAAAPKKQIPPPPAPTPVEEESGDNMLPLYAGGGLIVALLGLYLARRKKNNEQDFAATDAVADEPRNLFEDATTDIEVQEEFPAQEETTNIESESLLSEFTPSEFENLEESQEADPLTEADVYIAYGRYQQAEDLIQKALQEDPENEALKLKLLDVYFSSENTEGFEDLAKELDYLKTSNPDMWEGVSNMGAEVCPESVLFVSPMTEDDANIPTEDSSEMVQNAEDELSETLSEIQESSNDLESIEFEMPEEASSESIDSIESAPESSTETEEPASTNDDFDFDFDLVKPDEESPDVEDSAINENAETKLSLAEAYIDMLDMESAKEALEEVMETGNADQIEKAKTLLEKL